MPEPNYGKIKTVISSPGWLEVKALFERERDRLAKELEISNELDLRTLQKRLQQTIKMIQLPEQYCKEQEELEKEKRKDNGRS